MDVGGPFDQDRRYSHNMGKGISLCNQGEPGLGRLLSLEHLHLAVLKGLGEPFDAALVKKLSHPSPNQRPKSFLKLLRLIVYLFKRA